MSRAPWWIWRPVQTRLTKWTLALLRGRKYTVSLEPEGTGSHDPINRAIQTNPELFPDQPVDVQFRATQGILAHEVGHALFSSAWPEAGRHLLCQMVNILEDERVERAMTTLYPGIAPAIQLVGNLSYQRVQPLSIDREDFRPRLVHACLAWRWAQARTGEKEMFRRVGLTGRTQEARSARKLWLEVKPVVEASWVARDTDEVIRRARDILRIIGLPEKAAPLEIREMSIRGIPLRGKGGAEAPLPIPSGPAPDGPGLGMAPQEQGHGKGPGKARLVEPAAYVQIEDAARPLATRLAEALKEPTPDRCPAAAEWGGRYSFRQEARTPDTPFLRPGEVGPDRRSLALYLLVDRSGSMSILADQVRLAVMSFHLACREIGVPLAIAYFGDETETPDPVDEVVTFGDSGEWPKAMIAGYQGHTGAEFLAWGLRKGERALQQRPEHLRAIVVVHDGQPVAEVKRNGRLVRDWDLSLAHVRWLERHGIPVIGLYLGAEDRYAAQMQALFPRLATCRAEELPEKLGNLLRGLA